MARKTVGFDPAVHGFAFPNGFVDVALTLPNGTAITTRGRCGGMAYLALDYFLAGKPVPRVDRRLFAPGRVPPDGNWVADTIKSRLMDSFFTGSALKFLTWSVLPDGDVLVLDGVRRETREELPKVVAAIDAGRPVVLGLVAARSLAAVGTNHQLIAYGYDRTPAGTTLLLHDNNSPGTEVTLTAVDGGWRASNGPTWRGFFVQDYEPAKPRVLTSTPADPARALRAGDVVTLQHVWTGIVLATSGVRWDHDRSSGRNRVTCAGGLGQGTSWRLSRTEDGPSAASSEGASSSSTTPGAVLTDGDVLRLTHPSGRRLRSQRGVPSPLTGQQEVSTTDAAPGPDDDWRLEVDGGGRWRAGSRVRLVHVRTGAALHSHRKRLPDGQHEVTGFAGRDDNDWWTVLQVG